MLVDRSLRSMAGFTSVCAIVMLIIVCCYLPAFKKRLNTHSTSVGGKDGENCSTSQSRTIVSAFEKLSCNSKLISLSKATHLFINIAATMLLGCSNTYQQLVTSLKVDEIPWVLCQRGDSKVGLNSPWSINHKRAGKAKAWLAWILLIATSLVSYYIPCLEKLR